MTRRDFFMEATMKQTNWFHVLIVLFVLLPLVGCSKAPATNPPAVETSLAATARALAQQTAAARPTATVTATATVTPTPTPRVSLNGTTLEFHEDQTAIFTDHKAEIQLVIPAGWMPFRVNEKEYFDAFTADVVL